MSKLTSEGKCKSKTPYINKVVATRAMRLLKGNRTLLGDTYNLKPYLCNVCSKWHIGHRYNNIENLFKELENQ
jgi:hypothetical protein